MYLMMLNGISWRYLKHSIALQVEESRIEEKLDDGRKTTADDACDV